MPRERERERERERGRERESAACGVILNTLVAISVILLFYVPYMFMFILPLVREMGGEISQSLFNPSTHTCRCAKFRSLIDTK